MRRLLSVVGLVVLTGCSSERGSPPSAQAPPSSGASAPAAAESGVGTTDDLDEPPMPFADWGACPFEGCQYGNWTATSDVVAINEPPFPWLFDRQRTGDAFRVRKGEKVFAVTGVVFFTKPGKARIDTELTARIESDRFPPGGGPEITIPAGSTIYLLTPQGEGWMRAWFKGRFVDFDASRLRTGPDGHCIDCAGELLERGQREWWIQLRNSRGVLGWTNQPQLFDGRDALG